MSLSAQSSLRDIALYPGGERVLESFKFLYCCHGQQSLAEACTRAGIDVAQVLAALGESRPASPNEVRVDWSTAPILEIVDHLLGRHHPFTRETLESLEPLVERVARVHGPNHAELERVKSLFGELRDDLEPHMFKEERVLFPYVAQLGAAEQGQPAPGRPMFGTVANPVRMMDHEHQRLGDLLAELRMLTSAYAVPEGACGSYRGMLALFQALDADLVRHVHLESNVLFPRALALEQRLVG